MGKLESIQDHANTIRQAVERIESITSGWAGGSYIRGTSVRARHAHDVVVPGCLDIDSLCEWLLVRAQTPDGQSGQAGVLHAIHRIHETSENIARVSEIFDECVVLLCRFSIGETDETRRAVEDDSEVCIIWQAKKLLRLAEKIAEAARLDRDSRESGGDGVDVDASTDSSSSDGITVGSDSDDYEALMRALERSRPIE